MFSNLEEQIQQTNGQHLSWTRHLIRVSSVVCVTTVLFGSLYLGSFCSSRLTRRPTTASERDGSSEHSNAAKARPDFGDP